MSDNSLRQIPSVNDVLAAEEIQSLSRDHAHDQVVAAVRAELAQLREQIRRGEGVDGASSLAGIAARVADRLGRELRPKLRPVINATGIVLHTNLGRSPIAEE